MTIRDEHFWKDQATDRMKVVLEKLDQDEVDWVGALKLTSEAREELGNYDIYKGPGETLGADRLDQVLKLIEFLQNELRQENRARAKHYAQSALKVLN